MAKRVNSAAAVYMIMLLVFAAGMWAILAYGSTLRAPFDLAGEWELLPEGDPHADVVRMGIEQSGRFVRLRQPGRRPLDLRVTKDEPAARRSVEMHGDGASAEFEETLVPNVFRVMLASPERRTYTGRLVVPTYSRPHAANKPQHPTTAPAAQHAR